MDRNEQDMMEFMQLAQGGDVTETSMEAELGEYAKLVEDYILDVTKKWLLEHTHSTVPSSDWRPYTQLYYGH